MYNSIRDRYYLYIGQILSITMSDVLSMTIHDAQNLQKSWRWVENTGLILSRCPYTSCPTQTNTQHKYRRTQSRDPPLHCVSSHLLCFSGLMPSTPSYRLSVIINFLFVGYVFVQMYGHKVIWLNIIQLDSGHWFTHQIFFCH